ncbi:hypothetical protein G6F54_007726 [Rhizopus delemar]|nr:hypothetical protein G6F54_007726 [Rhizopus delemar]
MTPSVRGRKPTVPVLSSEQVQNLYKQFETQRRQLICPNCQTIDSLYRNGSSTGNPPQPTFICKHCSKNYNAPTVAKLLQSTSITDLPPDSTTQNSMEISGSSAVNSENNDGTSSVTIADLQSTITTLYAELKQTQAELQQAREEIQTLRRQQASADSLPHAELSGSQFPPMPAASQPLPPWRDAARLNSIKASMLEKRQQRRLQRQETAARILQPPSENQGFQYIYVPTKARVPVGQLRSRLCKLDINNSRILDIHYPTRNVVTLLVHNDYAPELKSHLQKFKVRTKDDFNPCDGSILMDPKYEQSSKEERDDFALMHHSDRVKKALSYIRAPVKAAVAPESSSVLLITESWLLSPNRYPTSWQQFHTYGQPIQSIKNRGSLGIALLVNPSCPFSVQHIPPRHTLLAKYTLSFIIAKYLVHCLYLPPSLSHTEVSNILDLLPLDLPNITSTVICGDLNARLGQITGDTLHTHRGQVIYDWTKSHDMTIWNERLTYGSPTYMTYNGSSIIDYFISTTELPYPQLIIRNDLSLDSYHKFMTFSFQVTTASPRTCPPKRTLWHLNKLKDDKQRTQYIEHFSYLITDLIPTDFPSFDNRASAATYIEHFNRTLCQAIYQSLDSVCGRFTRRQDDFQQQFWTRELQESFDLKEYYYKKWRKAQGINRLKYWLLHQETKARLRRMILQRRRETWIDFCNKMEHGEYTKAIARLCKIRKNRNLKPSFSTIEGPEQAADVMASHLQTIYSGRLLQGVEEDHLSFYNSPPFSQETCPILLNDVKDALRQLPPKKAPGPDHIRQEMLTPLQPTLAPILLFLFQLCWTWSYTPAEWRLAQIIPIYKKGDPTEPGNHRPISLTSVFRKLLERSIHHFLIDHSPPLDIAQGGFRESRGSLDQALCLAEVCNILRRHYRITPVLASLDIKSAYDTVDRRQIWRTLEKTAPVALVSLLRNLFDEVQIEVLLNNATSTRFSPITGVLQGSILSPFLYSVYINELPQILRPHPISSDLTPTDLILRLNCLLYADDVVLIATKDDMGTLLQSCENHSYQLGYRWNPSKCVILDSSQSSSSYTLYGEKIPRHSSFPYLGIPFRPGGYLDTVGLVNRNKTKALATMNQLSAIGVHPKGFAPLLATRFYKQIVRAQLEYGLAITKITTFLSKQLEEAQNTCLRRIFGGSRTSSTTKMPCYTIFFHLSANPEATPNGTSSLSLPFGSDAPQIQSPWIAARYVQYSENTAKTISTTNVL